MKIIIAGAGEVGLHLTKMFSAGGDHNIVIVDTDPQRSHTIDTHYDVLTVTGSATSIAVLKDIGMRNTDLFISVTEKEETNITSCILAKKLGAKKTVARIDNQEYLTYQNTKLLNDLGVDHVTYPQRLAALEIANLIRETGVSESIEFSGGKLSLYAIKLDESAKVIGKTLQEVNLGRSLNYRAVAIERGDATIIPSGKDTFQLGDLVYVISNKDGLDKLMESSGKQHIDVRNIMILGGSRIGTRTAKELQHHFNVKLIELDENKSLQIADQLTKTLVLNGDGRDTELLEEEGIRKMDAFIAVTDNSDTNIIACLLAKKLGVKKTIAEIENVDYIQIAENIGIDTIINKKFLAASSIFAYTLSAEVHTMKCLTGTDAEIMEFVVHDDSEITGMELKSVDFPKNAIIGGIIRDKESFIATGKTIIESGDRVVVFALAEAVRDLERIFK
ncbi:MAG: Trk system potassium transporter TrkA [Bacteroidales bacterium]|nr:Trk system potassium transporter TrkA [Bacteroidales bacterium]